MATLTATIQGVPVQIIAGSFRSSETLNNRPVASFSLYFTGTPEGNEGDEVIITRIIDSNIVFAGRVQAINYSVDESGNASFASYSCGGYEVLTDRRLVAEAYTNKTAGYIVADILSKYLSADGITAGTISDGITIPKARFAYIQASQVLRNLAEASGYIWYITYDKELFFVERDFSNAPYEIDSTDINKRNVRNVSGSANLNQYRNRQIVQYNELTSVRTERFSGDGERQTFTVEFPIALIPTVAVNGISQTLGIGGLEDGKQWYWNSDTNQVAQSLNDIPIPTNSALEFIPALIDNQSFGSFSARGNHAVGIDVGTESIYLFNVSHTVASVAQIIVTGFDELQAITWIYDNYALLSYTDSAIDYLQVYRREGNSLTSVGSPVTATNETWLSNECSNGVYIATTVRNEADALELYKFEISTESIALVDTESAGGSAQFGYAVWNGDFLCFQSVASNVNIYKLDRFTDTLSSVYSFSEGLGNQVTSCAWVGNYLFTGFTAVTGSGTRNTVIRHSLDVATDTVTRLGSFTAQNSPNTSNIISVGQYIVIAPFTGTQLYDYYFVNESDGSVVYSGLYTNPGQSTTISLSVSRNVGANFVFGIGANTDKNVFILRPSPGVLSVTYQGSFPNVLQFDDLTEQADRIIIEGGTGLYESFQNSTNAIGEVQALGIAEAIIERYGRVPRVINFQTRLTDFETGQIVAVNWPLFGINNESFLIEKIDTVDESAAAIWYNLRCISGINIGNWQEFWRSLQPQSTYDFGGSDVIPKGVSVSEAVLITETVTAISADSETNWDEGNWDQMEWQ